MKATLPE